MEVEGGEVEGVEVEGRAVEGAEVEDREVEDEVHRTHDPVIAGADTVAGVEALEALAALLARVEADTVAGEETLGTGRPG